MFSNIIISAGKFLEEKGFRIEKSKIIDPGNITVDLYGFREGHSLWKLFPFEDHFFIYNLDESDLKSTEAFSNLHNTARIMVNSRFSKPKWMRYKVPNIITVGISNSAFPKEMKTMVSIPAPYGVGGEKHSMYLIDISEKKLYSAGIQRTSATAVTGGTAASVSLAPKNIDPTNRAYHLISEFLQTIF
ncbi:MAG: hypothetical protein CVV49_12585 [Spirochaetae bacterium HGW-Spirochaetae-5]|nr:MAG: hypothetical protein CVV49_12585 [Spirochaetae bacterium HGW-Spirochaetae-5]